MLAFILAFIPSSIASYLLTKILGFENRVPIIVVGAIIALPVGLTVNGVLTGTVGISVPVVMAVIAGPLAGYFAAAPFLIGL